MMSDDQELSVVASELFGSRELEEPSSRVDEAVMAAARRGVASNARRPVSAPVKTLGAIAAILVVAVTVTWFASSVFEEPASESATYALLPARDLESAVSSLRTEIEQIDEMAEILDDDGERTRAVIGERVKECLAKIRELERAIAIEESTQSSLSPETLETEENV